MKYQSNDRFSSNFQIALLQRTTHVTLTLMISTTPNEDEPKRKATSESIQELLIDNNTLNALVKGVLIDIEIFKKTNTPESISSIMRLNLQLEVLNNKKERNLKKITEILSEKGD